jgi:class 3 adenylate cyclase
VVQFRIFLLTNDMARIELTYKKLPADPDKYGEGYTLNSLSIEDFQSFSHRILELGDLSEEGKPINALAVFLDLQGFTRFCDQSDSHLVIPRFLQKYLGWLFSEIAEKFTEGLYVDHVKVWGSLPFYTKFLGDGILFLWNTDISGGLYGIENIICKLIDITDSYRNNFLPEIDKIISKPPPRVVRCGISRGQIISIGNGEDYVGSCINMASRLQKISMLTFAVSQKGLNFSLSPGHRIENELLLTKFRIWGIDTDELVYIRKNEYQNLPDKEKKLFKVIGK